MSVREREREKERERKLFERESVLNRDDERENPFLFLSPHKKKRKNGGGESCTKLSRELKEEPQCERTCVFCCVLMGDGVDGGVYIYVILFFEKKKREKFRIVYCPETPTQKRQLRKIFVTRHTKVSTTTTSTTTSTTSTTTTKKK